VAPASAHAQKPAFDIRTSAAPQIHATRPLTGPAPAADRMARARAFARAHAAALGLTPARVDALGAPERVTGGGIEQLRWRRSFSGIPAFDDELRIALGADGEVLAASGSTHDAAPATLTPALGPVEAMAVVRDDAGASGPPQVVRGPSGARRDTSFAGGGRARLVVFSGRLAWDVQLPALPAASYDTVVDATSGEILHRANLVKPDLPAHVWDDFPGSPLAPAHTVQLSDYGLTAQSTTLENAWIHVYANPGGDQPAPEEIHPDAQTGWDFPFHEFGSCAKPCGWDPSTPTSWRMNEAQNAVEAFHLANVYRAHLAQPPFSFGFTGNDKLNIETEWGAANDPDTEPDDFDNSFMDTEPPGTQSTMALSLFGVTYHPDGTLGFRAVNAADDASILFHEYSHAYDNRTVVFGNGFEALNTAQAWALDEASADFFAKSFLVDQGWEADTGTVGEVDMGNYTDATPNSIRAEPLDCPVGDETPACPGHGYTYADFGHVWGFGPEPHYDGEIWSETMWELRNALPSGLAVQLAAQAFRLVPTEPSFLDMRDAILKADANLGRNDAATIWAVFAHRGMGCDAKTDGSDDTVPQAGFSASCPVGPQPPTATPTPRLTPTPTPSPIAPPPRPQPSFVLKSSGHRGLAFTVTCHEQCNVTGTLTVDAKTARKLKLGKRRVVGRLTARLVGAKTFTVRLSSSAARALKRARKVKSFKATLTVQAGYAGAAVASTHRTVTVKR
jgi:hypothetical protein